MLHRKHFASWIVALIWILFPNQIFFLCGANDSRNVSSQVTKYAALKIGVLLSLKSNIGKAVKLALDIAVEHINGNTHLLNDIELNLILADSNCSVLQGATAAMELLNSEVIAIAGPQSSLVSHFVSHLASATHVPLVSFAATDPALAQFQYPYFTRVAPSDSAQMVAVAGIIGNYGWREVIALFTDDDYGAHAIDYLHNLLEGCGSKLVHREAIDPKVGNAGVISILTQINLMESRVFVVHTQPDMAKIIFTTAPSLRMVSSGYVWIVTDSISNILDSTYHESDAFFTATQGVIGTRSYIPESIRKKNFTNEWKSKVGDENSMKAKMTTYALYAYDSLWLIALGIQNFLRAGGNATFVDPGPLPADAGGKFDLAKLKALKNGELLLHQILKSEFTGVTGYVKLDAFGDRLDPPFEIVNMVGKGLRVVGYWTNMTGCSSIPPLVDYKGTLQAPNTAGKQQLNDVIWPGGHATKPHGWVIPKTGKPLIIGIPYKKGYTEFVSDTKAAYNSTSFHGFCIDVFQSALSYLPYAVPYTFVPFGNGTPDYDAMVEKIATKEFDAAVGDIAITTNRAKIVDFTQPYAESGLVVVVPVVSESSHHAWAFMRPFTLAMWITTSLFFFLMGLVVWLLEHKKNPDFRGRPKKQVVTALWFIFSTLFFAQSKWSLSWSIGKLLRVLLAGLCLLFGFL